LVFDLKNYNIQTGRLFDKNGKNFDITVILNFPTRSDYENSTGIDDFPSVTLIDFYFGETNDHDTEQFFNQFVDKQKKLRKLISKLNDLTPLLSDPSELDEHIEFIKSLIVQLH
jgi:predicted PolB exonuclease-like 3'-5' exonuclease